MSLLTEARVTTTTTKKEPMSVFLSNNFQNQPLPRTYLYAQTRNDENGPPQLSATQSLFSLTLHPQSKATGTSTTTSATVVREFQQGKIITMSQHQVVPRTGTHNTPYQCNEATEPVLPSPYNI
jgi:hypothetical protein